MSIAGPPRRPGTQGFVTLMIDLTSVLDKTGPARLLDLVTGRSAAALKTWLAEQPAASNERVEVIAMDGFGGYKSAATDQLPTATAVMDPFHVVALAAAKLYLIRQRIQPLTCGHRGRTGDPLYGVRRTLHTRFLLLTTRQRTRLEPVFADDNHLAVMVVWSVYQRVIAAYADPNRRRRKNAMITLIDPYAAARLPRLRNWPNWDAPCIAAALTSWHSSTTTSPTDPPKPSTAAWKPCAATPSDSETLPTTAGAHSSTAAHSTN